MVGLMGRALMDGGRMWWDEQAQARATPPFACSTCFHLLPRPAGAALYSLGSFLPRNLSKLSSPSMSERPISWPGPSSPTTLCA